MKDIDKLCELVNEKYNLLSNDVGSVEYHCDTCENSIVQIANKNRGVIQLVSGSNDTLIQYLNNILEDKIILNFWGL